MGGRQKDADELLWKVLGVQRAGPVLIPQEPFAAAYSQEMGIKDGAPSTGFVGAALQCLSCRLLAHSGRCHVEAAKQVSASLACKGSMRAIRFISARPVQAMALPRRAMAAHLLAKSIPVKRALQMTALTGCSSLGTGIRGVLLCTPDDTVIHLFGFNWHNSTWKGHKVPFLSPSRHASIDVIASVPVYA